MPPCATWYEEGLRVLQLAYGQSRGDARGPDERLGYGSDEGDQNGVTDLGRFAIAEMNALGMIVDCSHCSRQTTLDAAALSTKPIIANHANAEALTPHRRTKDDEELMAIAHTGGVIGVTPIPLDARHGRRRGRGYGRPDRPHRLHGVADRHRSRRPVDGRIHGRLGREFRGTTRTPTSLLWIGGCGSPPGCALAAGRKKISPSYSAATSFGFTGKFSVRSSY